MALVDKKSKLDRNYRKILGPNVGESLPQDGQYFTDKGSSDSPFISKFIDPSGQADHMISLMKNSTVYSTGDEAAATGLTYKSAPNAIAERDQDLNGSDPTPDTPGAPNYFNGYGKGGKHQGKKLGGLDLHEALLENAYTYNHGEGTPTTILGANENGNEGGALDLDKIDGGQGYFHGEGLNNPGIGQGKKLKEVDLHEALLTNHYHYKHGNSKETILQNKGSDGGIYDLNTTAGGRGNAPLFDSGVPTQIHAEPLQSPNYTQLVEKYQSKVHNISGPYPFSGVYGPVGSPGGVGDPPRFQDLDGLDYGGEGTFPGNRRYSHPEKGTLYA